MSDRINHGTNLDAQVFEGTIPDHKVIRCIGSGAFGRVWLAINSLGNYRAVKTIERSKFRNSEKAFEVEWEGIKKYAANRIDHQRLVGIFHAGRARDDSYFYYIMELGDDLHRGIHIDPKTYQVHSLESHLIANNNRLPVSECIEIGIQLANALEQFHINGLLHRDVKPSNVIFVDGIPKLTDLGLVSEISGIHSPMSGTEGFSPVEGPNSIEADIYSLGKTLYEAATGLDRKQFPKIPLDWSSGTERKAFAELNDVLVTACHPDPEMRFSSARDMGAELIALKKGRSFRRFKLQHKSLESFKILTRVSFAICAVLIAIILLLVQKAQQEKDLSHLYATKKLEGISGRSRSYNTTAYAEWFLHANQQREAKGMLPPDTHNQFEKGLVSSIVADIPLMENFGVMVEKLTKQEGTVDISAGMDGVGDPFHVTSSTVNVSGERMYLGTGDGDLLQLFLPKGESTSKVKDNFSHLVHVRSDSEAPVRVMEHNLESDHLFINHLSGDVEVFDINTSQPIEYLNPTPNGNPQQTPAESIDVVDLKLSSDFKTLAVLYDNCSVALFDTASLTIVSHATLFGNGENYKLTGISWDKSGEFILITGMLPENFNEAEFSLLSPGFYSGLIVRVNKPAGGVKELGESRPFRIPGSRGGHRAHPGSIPGHFFMSDINGSVYSFKTSSHHWEGNASPESLITIYSHFKNDSTANLIAFCPELHLIAVSRADRRVTVYMGDDDQRVIAELPHSAKITGMHFINNGTKLATTCADGSFRQWALSTKESPISVPVTSFDPDHGIGFRRITDGNIELVTFEDLPKVNEYAIAAQNIESDLDPGDAILTQPSITLDGKGIFFQLEYPGNPDSQIPGFNHWTLLDIESIRNSRDGKYSIAHRFSTPEFAEVNVLLEPFISLARKDYNIPSPSLEMMNSQGKKISILSANPKRMVYQIHPSHKFIITAELDPSLVRPKSSRLRQSNASEDSDFNHFSSVMVSAYDTTTLEKVSQAVLPHYPGHVSSIVTGADGSTILITGKSPEDNPMPLYVVAFDPVKGKFKKAPQNVFTGRGFTHGLVLDAPNEYILSGSQNSINHIRDGHIVNQVTLYSEIISLQFIQDDSLIHATTAANELIFLDRETFEFLPSPYESFRDQTTRLYVNPDADYAAAFNPGDSKVYYRNIQPLNGMTAEKITGYLSFLFYGYGNSYKAPVNDTSLDKFLSTSDVHPAKGDLNYSRRLENQYFQGFIRDEDNKNSIMNATSINRFIEGALLDLNKM